MIKDTMVKSGNSLFKYRGQIPVVLFILSVFFIWKMNYNPTSAYDKLGQLFAVIISMVGFFIRFIAIGTTPAGTSGRNTEKQVAESLNEQGIYSMVRHPLYLGNYFIWLGIVVYTLNPYFMVIFSLLYWVYYERIMMAEEDFLESKFGAAYRLWSEKTPSFIPSFKGYIPSTVPFSWKSILRREYSGILATAIGFAFVDFWIYSIHFDLQEYPTQTIIVLLAALLFAGIMKLLKKYTHLLQESGRS